MEISYEDFERDDSQVCKDIVEAIRRSIFVAIDLEFSGVLKKFNNIGRRQNVNERYLQLKEGASMYQVLQLGICTVEYDNEVGAYFMRPFTFPLCPVTDSKWGMEREFTHQASAIKFLSDNHFDFNKQCSNGIRWLSHEEEALVREKEKQNLEGILADIHVEESQKEFLNKVIKDLRGWLADPKPEHDFFNIPGPGNELNGYQKRLVHQSIRANFPGLVTTGRGSFIQVTKKDMKRDAEAMKERKERSDQAIERGIGLRAVFDAMRKYKTPLVGHNCFGDIIHLYKTFVGTLPGTLDGFKAMLHADFPVICDTKYLATCQGTEVGAASNLQTLSETLLKLPYPKIIHHTMLSKVDHNAGYDSFITAVVFVKLVLNYRTRLEGFWENETVTEHKARSGMIEFINLMGRTQYKDDQGMGPEIEGTPDPLPPFDDKIFEGLVNRLRVNGTEEGVVALDTLGDDESGSAELQMIDTNT